MSKKQKNPTKEISVFPFFPSVVQSKLFGVWIALTYFVAMLFIGLKYHIVGDYNVETDFFQAYVPTAKNILKGIWEIEDFRGPGYPAVLVFFGMFFNDFFRTGIIVSALAASFTLFFTFETIRKLFRADVAFIVTLLVAVNKTFVTYAYTAGTDMTFNVFVTAIVFFLLRSEKHSWLNLVAVAFFSAAAYLTRYNGIFVLLAIPSIIIFLNIYSVKMKERIIYSATFILLFFLFIAPWGFHSSNEKGSFFFNKNYLNIAYEMFAKGKMGWDQYWNVESTKYTSLAQVVFADPSLFVSTVFKNIFEHFISDMELLVGWGTGALFVLGLIGLWRERPNVQQASLYIFGVFFFLVLLIVFYGERFSLFLLPIYAAIAVSALMWKGWKKIPFYNGFIIALVLIIWSFSNSYNYNRENIDSGPKEIVAIADWFNTNVKDFDESKIVVCRKPHIAFYINKTMKYFPYVETWDALETETKKLNASYFFFGVFEANMRPQFQQLLDPRQAPAWLEPITYTQNPPSVLYKVK